MKALRIDLSRDHRGQSRREEKHHAEDDENRDDDPDGVDYLFGFVVEKKTHTEMVELYCMYRYSQKDRKKPARLFLKRIALAGMAIIVVVAASGVWSVYQKDRESSAMRVAAERGLADLEKRQAALSAQLQTLGTDRGKEAILRQQYGLAAAGEGEIVIVDPSPDKPILATSSPDWLHRTFPWW